MKRSLLIVAAIGLIAIGVMASVRAKPAPKDISDQPRPVTLDKLEGKWRGNVIRRNIELNPFHPQCDQIEFTVRLLTESEARLLMYAPVPVSDRFHSDGYIMSIEAFTLSPRRRKTLRDSQGGVLFVDKDATTWFRFGGPGGCLSFDAEFIGDRLRLHGFVDVDLDRCD